MRRRQPTALGGIETGKESEVTVPMYEEDVESDGEDDTAPLKDFLDAPELADWTVPGTESRFPIPLDRLEGYPDMKTLRGIRRQEAPPGFYVCFYKGLRRLHHLGSCYRTPWVDFFHFSFLGTPTPAKEMYDDVCGECVKRGKLILECPTLPEVALSSDSDSESSGSSSS